MVDSTVLVSRLQATAPIQRSVGPRRLHRASDASWRGGSRRDPLSVSGRPEEGVRRKLVGAQVEIAEQAILEAFEPPALDTSGVKPERVRKRFLPSILRMSTDTRSETDSHPVAPAENADPSRSAQFLQIVCSLQPIPINSDCTQQHIGAGFIFRRFDGFVPGGCS